MEIRINQSDVVVGQVAVDGADHGPVDGGGDLAGGVVAVDVARHLIERQLLIEVAFTVPQRLSKGWGIGGGIAAPAGTVGSHHIDGVSDDDRTWHV